MHRKQIELATRVKSALLSLRHSLRGSRVVAGSKQLELLRELKQQVSALQMQAVSLHRALNKVLEEDGDLARMYLSRLHASPEPPAQAREHEEAEMLLESYLLEVEGDTSALAMVSYEIDSTEKFVAFRLDSARNRLLKVDIISTTAASIFGFGSCVFGLFGMNLSTPIFDLSKDDPIRHGWLFDLVVLATLTVMVLAAVGLFCFFYAPRRRAARAVAVRPLAAAADSWRTVLAEWDLDEAQVREAGGRGLEGGSLEEMTEKLARGDEAAVGRPVMHSPSMVDAMTMAAEGADLVRRGGTIGGGGR